MKRFLFGFLAALFLILNTIPYLHILADDMPSSSQYEMLGAFALSSLITTGEATELDFSDYTETDTSFLIDLGEAIFTGDWSGLAEDGLEWLGETADSVYDSYKEYVSQWKSDNLGIMYSNWFPDEQIYVGPDNSYNSNLRDLSQPLRRLLTPPDDNSPTPNPDPDFSFITYDTDFYISGTDVLFYESNLPISINTSEYLSISDKLNYTAVRGRSYNSSWSGQNTGYNYNYDFSLSPFVTFYINTNSDDSVTVIASNFQVTHIIPSYDINTTTRFNGLSIYRSTSQWASGNIGLYRTYNETSFNTDVTRILGQQSSFVGLSTAINWIHTYFRHYNLYVNDVLWVYSGNNTNYPIVIPDQLTIWNNQPLQYEFPSDTYLKLPDLTTIITNAINNSGVVMWSDIADCFVDVNGQTAVAVTKIVRNDYDNLYMEQYPYPAMLPGMTDQTKFNEHLLDNSHAYLSPMGTVVQETVNVLPSEVVGVLAIGAILTIFAVIINRLLE